MKFEVKHVGRGGFIKCVNQDKEINFPIACENTLGYFGIWIQYVTKEEKEIIKKSLRKWLDNTGRENWYFEN